jgi:hypothetical protein
MSNPDHHDVEEVTLQDDTEVTSVPLRSTAEQRRIPIGRPFPPGISGNPSGRPRGLAGLARERSLNGELLVDFAVDLVKGVPLEMEMIWPPKDASGQPTIIRYKITPNPKVRLEAAQWLADRGWGKPIQEVEVAPGPRFVVQHRIYKPGEDPLAQIEEGKVSLPPSRALPYRG